MKIWKKSTKFIFFKKYNLCLSKSEKKFEIESIKLIDIFQIVGHRDKQIGYNALFDDIAENGFKNPIIVIPNNQYNYDLALRQVKSQYANTWQYFRKWICMYGNQRMDIALKLGTVGHLKSLKRTRIGNVDKKVCITMKEFPKWLSARI